MTHSCYSCCSHCSHSHNHHHHHYKHHHHDNHHHHHDNHHHHHDNHHHHHDNHHHHHDNHHHHHNKSTSQEPTKRLAVVKHIETSLPIALKNRSNHLGIHIEFLRSHHKQGSLFVKANARNYTGHDSGDASVAKWVRPDHPCKHPHNHLNMAVKIADKALQLCDGFNRDVARRNNWKVVVNIPRKWKSVSVKGGFILVERYIHKFGELEDRNTKGGKRPTWLKLADALSHYSYVASYGKLVLCGLQGGVREYGDRSGGNLILVDPKIVSHSKYEWGCRDGGEKELDSFFKKHHTCNKFCQDYAKPNDQKVFYKPV